MTPVRRRYSLSHFIKWLKEEDIAQCLAWRKWSKKEWVLTDYYYCAGCCCSY